MNLKDTIENYKQIVLINEVGYIGDSCIFFWPIVESCVTCFPDKTFTIYHQYSEVFNSLHTNLSCLDLKNINKQDSDTKTDFKIEETLVISFISELGECSKYFRDKGFLLIYKRFVGLDFWTSNMESLVFSSAFDYNVIASDNKTYKYQFEVPALQDNSTNIRLSSFPPIGKFFSNVYEYAKICNSTFLGLDVPLKLDASYLNISTPENKQFNDLFISPLKDESKPFVFFNFNVGNHKDKLLKTQGGLLDIFEGMLRGFNFFDRVNFIISFPDMEMNLYLSLNNLIIKFNRENSISILKIESKVYWKYLQINASKIVSYDTGFVHLAYVLNDNVLSIGGDSQFWHFPGCNYIKMNHYDKNDFFLPYKLDHSVNEIIDWIKTND